MTTEPTAFKTAADRCQGRRAHHAGRWIFSLAVLWLCAGNPLNADAASFQIRSESVLGVFERENQDGDNRHVVPFFEYLQLDIGEAGEEPVSLHLHGWLRADAADANYYEEDTDGELLYGYVAFTSPDDALTAKLGRQHVFSGIINDRLDGIGLTGYLGPYFSVSAYGGLPAAYQEDDGTSGDGMLGTRLALHAASVSEIGLSYKNVVNDRDTVEQAAGVDLSLGFSPNWFLSGLSCWNLETSGWREHAYEASITLHPLFINPFYQYVQYEDYFTNQAGRARPFGFLEGTQERLTIAGSKALWQAISWLEFGAVYKHYAYELRSESSQYTAALLNVYGRGATSGGIEAGLMDGSADVNRYRLARAFFFWDTPFSVFEEWFVSGDVVFVSYEKKIYNQDHSLFASLGTGTSLGADNLQVEVSGSYSADPYFDNDFRMMMVVKFNLTS